jgi:hypothetical protein
MKPFPRKSGIRLFPLLVKIISEFLARAIIQEKEKQGIQTR